MSEHMRPMSGRDLPTDEPQWVKVEEVKVEDLLRVADNCRDLLDPTVMAKAWDEPTTPDVQLAPTSPRRFGLLPNFAVSDTFDDPLPEAEIAVRGDDSPPETPVTIWGPYGELLQRDAMTLRVTPISWTTVQF